VLVIYPSPLSVIVITCSNTYYNLHNETTNLVSSHTCFIKDLIVPITIFKDKIHIKSFIYLD